MISSYILGFFFALTISLLVTPLVINVAERFKVMDRPDPRKVHSRYTPRWGGLGIYFGFIGSLGLLYLLNIKYFRTLLSFPLEKLVKDVPTPTIMTYLGGIIIGGTIIIFLGMIDDKKGVDALTKLLTQIIVAMVVLQYGIKIIGVTNPFSGNYIRFPIIVSTIITAIWIIGFVNSVNLIDGMDGLAAGIVGITAITFFIVTIFQIDMQGSVAITKGLKLVALLSACLVGSVLGFLRYNFNPARIFMGDTGSMFLGFMLGTLTIIGILKTTAAIALVIPIIVFGVPILDAGFAIIRRLFNKQPIMKADKGHFHHILLNLGWSPRRVVITMYCISAVLGVIAIILTISKG